jgi:hypothetical protein
MAAVHLSIDANSIRAPDDRPWSISHDESMTNNLPRDVVAELAINPNTAAQYEAEGAA